MKIPHAAGLRFRSPSSVDVPPVRADGTVGLAVDG